MKPILKRGLLLLVIFLVILGSVFLALPSDNEITEVIGYIEECRDIHVYWIEFLIECPEFDYSQVGDVQWHELWVERYNATLEVLYATRRLTQLLNPFTTFKALNEYLMFNTFLTVSGSISERCDVDTRSRKTYTTPTRLVTWRACPHRLSN